MDQPLSKSDADFPSPERKIREERIAALQSPAFQSLDELTINGSFRSFAAGEPIRVHALDVGAGNCIVIECPGSDDVLMYDCGSLKATSNDMNREQVKSFVEEKVGESHPIVALSHGHIDHVNMIPDALAALTAQSIWLGGKATDYGKSEGDDLQAWLEAQSNAGVTIHHDFDPEFNNGGEPIAEMQCGEAETYILTVNTPPEGRGDNRRMHANSLIVMVHYGDFRVVMTGDAVEEAELSALNAYGALLKDTTLLFASHHGARSNGSNAEEWISGLSPSIVVYSADTKPGYGHPKGEIVDRYRAGNTLLETNPHPIWWDPESPDSPQESTTRAEYVTELNGRITVESDGVEDLKVSCARSPDCW